MCLGDVQLSKVLYSVPNTCERTEAGLEWLCWGEDKPLHKPVLSHGAGDSSRGGADRGGKQQGFVYILDEFRNG